MRLVKRFFRQLPDAAVREGGFGSVAILLTAINVRLTPLDRSPQLHRWKAEGSAILQESAEPPRPKPKSILTHFPNGGGRREARLN